MPWATSSDAFALISVTTTVAPSRANISALARPMPLPAPVMMQILSCSRFTSFLQSTDPLLFSTDGLRTERVLQGRSGTAHAHVVGVLIPKHPIRAVGIRHDLRRN